MSSTVLLPTLGKDFHHILQVCIFRPQVPDVNLKTHVIDIAAMGMSKRDPMRSLISSIKQYSAWMYSVLRTGHSNLNRHSRLDP